MRTHTMTTDADGRAHFRCWAPADAACRVWADCLSTDGCESDAEDCVHPQVHHDHCIYSEWWATPEDAECMHKNEYGDIDVTPKPNMDDAPIDIEWDECPLWSFAERAAA